MSRAAAKRAVVERVSDRAPSAWASQGQACTFESPSSVEIHVSVSTTSAVMSHMASALKGGSSESIRGATIGGFGASSRLMSEGDGDGIPSSDDDGR